MSQTRSPLETRPPVQTHSPYPAFSHPAEAEAGLTGSTSRPPLPPPLERRPHARPHFLRTAGYLFLGAALVIAGWNLLPHGSAQTVRAGKQQNYSPDPNRFSDQTPPSDPSTAAPATATPPARDTATELREPGLRHITTLQLAGSFSQAAEYAVAAPLDFRRDFIIAAYHEWGRHQPDQALASAIRIEEGFSRDWAVYSVFSGWARTDPEGMAETALAFPDSEYKKAALTKALRAWMVKDPNVAGDWILAHPDAVPVADEMFRKDRR